jgi:hypothetical protein
MSSLRRTRRAPDRLAPSEPDKKAAKKPANKKKKPQTNKKKKQAAEESGSDHTHAEWEEDWDDSDEPEKKGSKNKKGYTSAELLELELTQLNPEERGEYTARVLEEYSDEEDAPVDKRRDILLNVLFKHMHFEKQIDHRCAIHAFNHVLQKRVFVWRKPKANEVSLMKVCTEMEREYVKTENNLGLSSAVENAMEFLGGVHDLNSVRNKEEHAGYWRIAFPKLPLPDYDTITRTRMTFEEAQVARARLTQAMKRTVKIAEAKTVTCDRSSGVTPFQIMPFMARNVGMTVEYGRVGSETNERLSEMLADPRCVGAVRHVKQGAHWSAIVKFDGDCPADYCRVFESLDRTKFECEPIVMFFDSNPVDPQSGYVLFMMLTDNSVDCPAVRRARAAMGAALGAPQRPSPPRAPRREMPNSKSKSKSKSPEKPPSISLSSRSRSRSRERSRERPRSRSPTRSRSRERSRERSPPRPAKKDLNAKKQRDEEWEPESPVSSETD